jgi:Kef-type K+ transport system membrane component KefB
MPVTPAVLGQLTWVLLAAVLAPVLVELLSRFAIPGVVLEIVLGIVLGPQLLDWVHPVGVLLDFGNIGLALLMFLAGYELDVRVVRGRPLRLAAISWAGPLVVALIIALVLIIAGHRHGEVVIGLAVTTTALGTLLPILRDTGVLATGFGHHILAVGSIGEFGPIVLLALLLGGSNPALTIVLLAGFGLLAFGCAYAAARPWGRTITDSLRRGLHATSQLPVRVAMLLIIALVLLATHLGLDVLLGAFAAGVIVRVAVAGREDYEETAAFRGKLEAIGFGLFVPIFFIISGTKLDLDAFSSHPAALPAIPLFLMLMLIARGGPVLLVYRKVLAAAERHSLALVSATGLPLIVVITAIGVDNDYVAPQTAAALVTAGMVSVLILPMLALRVLGSSSLDRSGPDSDAERL